MEVLAGTRIDEKTIQSAVITFSDYARTAAALSPFDDPAPGRTDLRPPPALMPANARNLAIEQFNATDVQPNCSTIDVADNPRVEVKRSTVATVTHAKRASSLVIMKESTARIIFKCVRAALRYGAALSGNGSRSSIGSGEYDGLELWPAKPEFRVHIQSVR